MFDCFASGGLRFSGWVSRRAVDEFGIACAAAFTSKSWRAATGASPSWVAVEAPYRAQVTPWLAVHPDMHYIRRPWADRAIADALVIGLRAEASFSLLRH